MYMYVYMEYLYIQKNALDVLELELQLVVSHPMCRELKSDSIEEQQAYSITELYSQLTKYI